MMPLPCALSDWISEITLRCSGTPSAAVGSSMMTRRAFQYMARPMATAWRWPPEKAATGASRRMTWKSSCAIVSLRRLRHRLAVDDRQEAEQLLHRLAAEEDVGADRQIVGQRQVLVDRLDAVVAGLLRRGERDALAVERDVALVIVEHAGDRLDQRRLAGAVVAGKRHDLAGMDVERDVARAWTPPKCLETSLDGKDRGLITQLDALP